MGARGPLGKSDTSHHGRLLKVVPDPPDDLGDAGRAEWVRVAGELGPEGRNVLTEASVGLLEDLARLSDDAADFRAEWKREGLTVAGKGREFGHPMIAAEREARRTIQQIRRDLGVTPSSASRVPRGPEIEDPKAVDPLAEFD